MSLYAIRMDATASEGNEFPPDSRHLLVLVRGHSEEAAIAEALVALTDRCWRDGEMKEIQPFGVAPSSLADPILREAALKAERGDRAIVVFGHE